MSNGDLPVPRWLQLRLNVWLRRVSLDGWTIRIKMLPTMKGDVIARMVWARGYHDARLEVSTKRYDELTPLRVDLTLLHELYHLIAAREDDRMEDLIGSESYVYKAYSKEQELIAEAFAHAMVKAYSRKKEG